MAVSIRKNLEQPPHILYMWVCFFLNMVYFTFFQRKIMALTWPFCRTCQDFHIFGRLSKAVRQRIPSPWTSCMLWRKRRMRPLAAHGSLAWAQFSFIYGQVILWHINTHVVYVYYIYVCFNICIFVYVTCVCMHMILLIYTHRISVFFIDADRL